MRGILLDKQQNPKADTSKLERQIYQFFYKIYDSTKEEIKIVEGV